MGVSLIKGQKIDLTKNKKDLEYFHIGIDWKSSSNLDIDASAFLLGENEQITRDEDFIFYGQPESSNRSIRLEDSLSTIEKQYFAIDLQKISNEIQKISFTLTIYEAKLKNLTFAETKEIKIRIVNSKTQEEVAVFPINYDFTKESAIVLGALYRYSGEWKFHAVGAGFNGGLADLCQQYGLGVIEETTTYSDVMTPPNDRFQIVQEPDTTEKGEAIPPRPIDHVELTRTSLIQFDYSRIDELSQQSSQLVEIFEEQMHPAQKSTAVESGVTGNFNFFNEAETDIDDTGFIESLSEIESVFLTRLKNGRIPVAEAHIFFRENLTMPAVFLNAINEKANEYLGENLFFEQQESIFIDEEFGFIIEKVEER